MQSIYRSFCEESKSRVMNVGYLHDANFMYLYEALISSLIDSSTYLSGLKLHTDS